MKGQRSKPGDTRVSPNGYHYTRTDKRWELTGRIVAGEARGFPLEANERIRYVDKNPMNLTPDNIQVYIVKEGTKASKRNQLQNRIDRLQDQIDALDAED